MSLVDAGGKPINGQKLTPEQAMPNPNKGDPRKEISKIIRIIEASRRIDLADLCATLEAVALAGWQLTVDENLPDTRAEITVVTHFGRDPNAQLQMRNERWVRLGKDYVQALLILKEHQEKQLEKTEDQAQAVLGKIAEVAGD